MDAARPADPRSIAHAGLEKSTGGFLRTRLAAASADRAVDEIIDVATTTGDQGALATARVGQATAEALRASPAARLGVLRAALGQIEGGAVSTVGYLSQLSYKLLDAVDAVKPKEGLRNEAVRTMLDTIAQQATATGLREAPYAQFMAELGRVTPHPTGALNMLARVNVSEVGDVMRPGWFATVASGFVSEAEFERDPVEAQKVLEIADPRILAEAVRQNDTATLQHFDREKKYARDLQLSPGGLLALHLATMRVAGDDVPFAPETALVLAHQFGQQAAWSARDYRKEDYRKVLDAAFTEARQAPLVPGTPTAAWLRFHDTVSGLGLSGEGRERLERAAFVALVEGRPATASELRFELDHALVTLPTDNVQAAVRPAYEALATLELHGSSTAPTDPQVADLGLRLADGLQRERPDLAVAMLEHAFNRLRDDPSDSQDRRTLIALGEFNLSRTGPEQRASVLRDTLQRFSRLETDEVQRAVLDAASSAPKEATSIEQQGDFVVIGGVRVPRRALAKS